MRVALTLRMRRLQTTLGKEYTKALLEQRDKQGFQSGKNNPGKTNAKVNTHAKIFRSAGRLFIVISVGSEVYTVASADEPLQELPRAGGRLGGAFGGGAAGAMAGAPCGPVGVAVGGLVGGIGGSFAGETVVDHLMSNPEAPYEGFWDDVIMP